MTPTPDHRPGPPGRPQGDVNSPSPGGLVAVLRAELAEARVLLAHAAAFRYPPALGERLLVELRAVYDDADEIGGHQALWLRQHGEQRWVITMYSLELVWHTGTNRWEHDERNSERTEKFSAHTRFPLPEARRILARVLAAHTADVQDRLRAQLAQARARRARPAAPDQAGRS